MPLVRIFPRRLALTTGGINIDFAHITFSKQIKEDLKICDIFLSSFYGITI